MKGRIAPVAGDADRGWPGNQLPPFDVKARCVWEINGVPMGTYIDWMRSCYSITVTGHPAISVPCGFTANGLPLGVQIVGRREQDFAVLHLAHAFDQATRAKAGGGVRCGAILNFEVEKRWKFCFGNEKT